jgi:hypothetical protein
LSAEILWLPAKEELPSRSTSREKRQSSVIEDIEDQEIENQRSRLIGYASESSGASTAARQSNRNSRPVTFSVKV